MNNTTMTKERYIQITNSFKAFVKDKANHPNVDKKYGTKYGGKISHVHFVVYAMLRGRAPELTTHSIEAKSFISAIKTLDEMAYCKAPATLQRLKLWDSIRKPFGLTEDEFRQIVLEALV